MLSSVVRNVLMLTSVTVIGAKVTNSVSWIVIGVVYTVVSVWIAVIVYGTGTRTVLTDVYVVPGSMSY
jgi:hypothetical protein